MRVGRRRCLTGSMGRENASSAVSSSSSRNGEELWCAVRGAGIGDTKPPILMRESATSSIRCGVWCFKLSTACLWPSAHESHTAADCEVARAIRELGRWPSPILVHALLTRTHACGSPPTRTCRSGSHRPGVAGLMGPHYRPLAASASTRPRRAGRPHPSSRRDPRSCPASATSDHQVSPHSEWRA